MHKESKRWPASAGIVLGNGTEIPRGEPFKKGAALGYEDNNSGIIQGEGPLRGAGGE